MGCDSIIDIQLNFETCEIEEDCKLYVPNVFSPNGDGINDDFEVARRSDCIIENFSVRIFDRWGAMVYTSTDENFKWDGYYKRVLLNPGTFVWTVEYRSVGLPDIVRVSGDVTIVR